MLAAQIITDIGIVLLGLALIIKTAIAQYQTDRENARLRDELAVRLQAERESNRKRLSDWQHELDTKEAQQSAVTYSLDNHLQKVKNKRTRDVHAAYESARTAYINSKPDKGVRPLLMQLRIPKRSQARINAEREKYRQRR